MYTVNIKKPESVFYLVTQSNSRPISISGKKEGSSVDQ